MLYVVYSCHRIFYDPVFNTYYSIVIIMGKCYSCSIFGMCISVWAIIQLTIMGICYAIESVTLLEDVEPHDPDSFDEFIKGCRRNYQMTAFNCFFVAYIYIWLFIICLFFVLKCRLSDNKLAAKLQDDDYFCNPPPPKRCCRRKNVTK